MPDGMINNRFDQFLEQVGNGFTREERKQVNHEGDRVYEMAMSQFLQQHRTPTVYKNGTEHLADTLTHEVKPDGGYEIGFSEKGKKAYIARLLNDGWESRNQYGGPYRHVQPPEWHDFIAKIGKENDEKMGKEMANRAKGIMDRKARG